MARPSEYNYELCLEICDLITEGGYIRHILKSNPKYPDFTTWCRWKRNNEELRNLYINAQQDKTEAIIENIEGYKEKLIKGQIDPSTANVLIQTDKWLSAKFYPKMFGERIQHANDPENPIVSNIQVEIIPPKNDQ